MLVKFIKSLNQNSVGGCCKDVLQNKKFSKIFGGDF